MKHHQNRPHGIPWQEARRLAAQWLDAMEAQWRAAGIDPAHLRGAAGPVATYADQASYERLRPEDQPARVEDHAVIVRAAIQDARKRWEFRLVPMTLEQGPYLEWLGDRENTAGARAEFLARQFAALALDP